MKRNWLFDKYKAHIGHHIECACYTCNDKIVNISIECMDCYEVLSDADGYEKDEE